MQIVGRHPKGMKYFINILKTITSDELVIITKKFSINVTLHIELYPAEITVFVKGLSMFWRGFIKSSQNLSCFSFPNEP